MEGVGGHEKENLKMMQKKGPDYDERFHPQSLLT